MLSDKQKNWIKRHFPWNGVGDFYFLGVRIDNNMKFEALVDVRDGEMSFKDFEYKFLGDEVEYNA